MTAEGTKGVLQTHICNVFAAPYRTATSDGNLWRGGGPLLLGVGASENAARSLRERSKFGGVGATRVRPKTRPLPKFAERDCYLRIGIPNVRLTCTQ